MLKKKKVFIKRMHWLGSVEGSRLRGRIRHLGELYPGRLRKEKGRWVFEFNRGVEGLAEGQYLVLYKRDILVGGGEIRLR